MQPPKLDLLDYITQDFDPDREHGITFIPLNINYERVVEDQGLNMNQDEHEIRKPGTPFVLKFAFEFLSKSMWSSLIDGVLGSAGRARNSARLYRYAAG